MSSGRVRGKLGSIRKFRTGTGKKMQMRDARPSKSPQGNRHEGNGEKVVLWGNHDSGNTGGA